jgi:hypothetical protein
MNDELELLRDFGSGLPAASEETAQRAYRYATSAPTSPWHGQSRLSSPSRLRLAAAIAVLCAAAGVAGATATIGGGASPRSAAVRSSGVDSVFAQVQSAFHDGQLIAASVQGSGLTVTLSNSGPGAIEIGPFEAQVLAFAVNQWMKANNQQPISQVSYVDRTGQALHDVATGAAVGSLPSAPALASAACQAAAANAQSPLSAVSAELVPFAGGACVITLQSSDATTFDASAANSLRAVQSAGSAAGDHPLLVEVDGPSGNPLVITSYVPGIDGVASNGTWVSAGVDDSGLGHN